MTDALDIASETDPHSPSVAMLLNNCGIVYDQRAASDAAEVVMCKGRGFDILIAMQLSLSSVYWLLSIGSAACG